MPAANPTVTARRVRASASGKALITGGYLILKQPNSGLVVATTSRFYTTAAWAPSDATAALPAAPAIPAASGGAADGDDVSTAVTLPVVVVSPQFGSTTVFHLAIGEAAAAVAGGEEGGGGDDDDDDAGGGVSVAATQVGLPDGEEPNLYLMAPVKLAARALSVLEPTHFLAAARAAVAAGLMLRVTLQADNDFYSQREVLLERGMSLTAVGELPKFMPYRGAKTGLGSSAALVASLTGAMLAVMADASGPYARFDGPVALSPGKTLAFVVAQLAHAEAQHSIGSGFDIASAVVGSCRYVRFSPARLAGVVAASGADAPPALSNAKFRALLLDRWDHEVTEFALPPRFELLMGDVSAGSVTTSMSRRVLKWLAEGGGAAAAHWAEVAATNAQVEMAFVAVSAIAERAPAEYDAALDRLRAVPATEWPEVAVAMGKADGNQQGAAVVVDAVVKLVAELRKVRTVMRRMGELAGPPIEPPEQTKLCDASAALPGVVTCACPGAGGFDAVYALAIAGRKGEQVGADSPSVALRNLWAGWEAPEENPGLGKVTPLALTADNNMGLRCEWLEAEEAVPAAE